MKLDLDRINLETGTHKSRKQGLCAMEAVAWLAGEKHSDTPECACPVVTRYMQSLNDRLPFNERQLLKAYLPRIIGTRDGRSEKRARILIKNTLTRIIPLALDLAGHKKEADALRRAKTLQRSKKLTQAALERLEDVDHTPLVHGLIMATGDADKAGFIATDLLEMTTVLGTKKAMFIRMLVLQEILATLDEILTVKGKSRADTDRNKTQGAL